MVALFAVVAEFALLSRRKRPVTATENETTFGVSFGWLVIAPITGALTFATIAFGFGHSVAHLGGSPWALPVLFLLADFLYYLWHRSNHGLRWLWATHVVHHSARRLTLLTSFRQGWTDILSGTWLFWAPLGFLGFSPAECGLYFTSLLFVQFLVHNEWIPALGPIELMMVTPSHHRVHHSLLPEHLDRNFGGVFIIWDRLFGTFAEEGSAPLLDFGVIGLADGGVLSTVFGEWRAIIIDTVSRFRSAG